MSQSSTHMLCSTFVSAKIRHGNLKTSVFNFCGSMLPGFADFNAKNNKKKGGRPPTGRVRKLSKSVTVKFSKPSYEALKLRARKANRKLAEYIRESALNGEVVSGHNAETVAIAKSLIGMANNLNQLTKLSHQRGFHETHAYVVDLLRRLKAILGEYRQASYKPKPSSMGRKEDTT